MELFDEYAIRCDATIPLSEINILQCDVAQPFVIGFPRQIQEKPFHFSRSTWTRCGRRLASPSMSW